MRLLLIAPLTAALALSACSINQSSQSEKESGIKDVLPKATSSKAEPTPHKAIIPDWLLEPYTKKGYPSTFKKFKDRMPDLQRYRIAAANKAASNTSCKKVAMAEISDRSTYSNMQFWVDCEKQDGTYTRFRFTESELDNQNSVAISESNKAYSKERAGMLCKELIKRSVNYPSTLGVNTFDYGYRKFPTLGNVEVAMDFKAKNAFNLELKYTARCLFKPGNPNGEITIKERSN